MYKRKSVEEENEEKIEMKMKIQLYFSNAKKAFFLSNDFCVSVCGVKNKLLFCCYEQK